VQPGINNPVAGVTFPIAFSAIPFVTLSFESQSNHISGGNYAIAMTPTSYGVGTTGFSIAINFTSNTAQTITGIILWRAVGTE